MAVDGGRRSVLIGWPVGCRGSGTGPRPGKRRCRLGIVGWARNLPGGDVEVCAEGSPRAVGQMIDWCRQGPPAAMVESVEVRESAVEGREGFDIRR